MNETDRVREWRNSKRKQCPGNCGTEVAYDTKFCRKCTGRQRTEKALNQTVGEVKSKSKSLRWTDHVRALARTLHKFDKCVVCGYDKIVHICHRRDISSFPDTATMREINSPGNVVGLCPNHHWEYDHGHLESEKVFKPVVAGPGGTLTFILGNGETKTFTVGEDMVGLYIDQHVRVEMLPE